MKYTVTLKDRVTGDRRDYTQDYDYQDDADDPERYYTADEKVAYQWLEGNYECDCNRALFLWNWAGEEVPCNQYQNDATRRIDLLKIVDDTGRLVYNKPANQAAEADTER